MRPEYSTKGGRRQGAKCFQSPFSNRFVGEWTYILELAAGRCGGLTLPYPTQGSLERGKRVSCPGQDEIPCWRCFQLETEMFDTPNAPCSNR